MTTKKGGMPRVLKRPVARKFDAGRLMLPGDRLPVAYLRTLRLALSFALALQNHFAFVLYRVASGPCGLP